MLSKNIFMVYSIKTVTMLNIILWVHESTLYRWIRIGYIAHLSVLSAQIVLNSQPSFPQSDWELIVDTAVLLVQTKVQAERISLEFVAGIPPRPPLALTRPPCSPFSTGEVTWGLFFCCCKWSDMCWELPQKLWISIWVKTKNIIRHHPTSFIQYQIIHVLTLDLVVWIFCTHS